MAHNQYTEEEKANCLERREQLADEGKSEAEIAKILGIALGTLYTWRYRAKNGMTPKEKHMAAKKPTHILRKKMQTLPVPEDTPAPTEARVMVFIGSPEQVSKLVKELR